MRISKSQLKQIVRESTNPKTDYQYWYAVGQSGGEYPREEEFGSEQEYIIASEAYEEGQDDAYEGPMIENRVKITKENTMKITKRQLRQIIKEEKARLMTENPNFEFRSELADEIIAAAKRGRLGVDYGIQEDELYIMTGAGEGITIKVIRRGR